MRARWMLVVTTLAALLLSGCVPDPAPTPVEPKPSSVPVFASEEEALVAAVEAYEAYLAVSDQIAADGGANPERLESLVTPEWYEKELEGFEAIRQAGLFQRGATASRNAELQSIEDDEVRINVCVDTSSTTFQDAAGVDATSGARKTLVTVEVTFAIQRDEILIDWNEPWASDSLC